MALNQGKFDKNVVKYQLEVLNVTWTNGIHGHENDEVDMQSVAHKNKLRFLMSRAFLTNKQYRKAKYPFLGKHWYLYPICLIKHISFLLTHKLGGFFKLVFKRNNRKDLFNKLGI